MINAIFTNRSDLITSVAQPIKDIAQTNQTIPAELKNAASNTDQELLSQFDDKRVEQLLHQQLASLIVISSQPAVLNYQYSDEELALRTVLTSQQEGLLNNENSDKLMGRLNKSVKNIQSAYANTSDILSSLGQLGHDQKSFLASSEQRVERTLGPYREKINRLNNEDNDIYRFELSVKTKEGDIINVTFNSSQDYDKSGGDTANGFSLSYQVEGDLSEAEHAALTEVLSGVGKMADEFFTLGYDLHSKFVNGSQADIDLGFLANINHQQLSDFDISLSTDDGRIEGPYSERALDLSYQFDQNSQQQALIFESNVGVEKIDFSLNMSTFGGTDVKSMQQYIATMDKNLEDSRQNSKGENKTSAFGKEGDVNMQQGFALFKKAFASLSSAAERYSRIESVAIQQFTDGRAMVADLVGNMITKDPRYKGLNSDTENMLGDGISILADFNAKFTFSKEPEGLSLRPKSTVELSQKTEQDKSGELHGITQSKTASTHFDYQGTRPDYYDKTESYKIGTAVKNQQLVGLDQQHKMNTDKETYRFNPEKSQYELMVKRTEQIANESNIRLINKIWLETNENSQTMNKKERVEERGKPDDFKKTNHHSYNKLITLIGDLDKLAENNNFKREYIVELDKVNFFMDKTD
jgi:hypothetical protein